MLRLHWSPDSANLPVRMALLQLDLGFEAVRVDRSTGAQKAAAYRALNPQGLIPVLEDGGSVFFETGAILLHLAERAGPLPAEERARVLPWLFWLSNTLHTDLRMGFRPALWSPAQPVALAEGVRARIAAHLALADEALANRRWPEAPGVCDLYLGACLRWAQLYPASGPVGWDQAATPALAGHLARVETLPAVRAACAAEAIPGDHPFTRPGRPALPPEQVTG